MRRREFTRRVGGATVTPAQKVAVTLLLRNGHERCARLDATDPSLLALLEAVAKRSDEKAQATVFNLELENGEGSLIFAACDLIAMSTRPAISIDLKVENPEIEFAHVIKENYLTSESLAALTKFVREHEAEFKPSKAVGGGRKSRKSLVLYDLGDFEEMFRELVRADLLEVLEKLQIPAFPVSEIEVQLTSHNNNHYFVRHRDSGPKVASRIVTFVYYFHNEPRGFEGGALRLYKGRLHNGIYSCGEAAVDLAPTRNTMLFFPSACYHEVLPIKCPSGEFRDSRFTVNGWIRRAK
jgi:SM-20-related protein